jgi:hypothetical protein
MTAPSSIDPAHFLHEQVAHASPDLLRHILTTFINTDHRLFGGGSGFELPALCRRC